MNELIEALSASKYDPWFLMVYWAGVMVVVWPAIIKLVQWWQIKPRANRKLRGIS